MTPRTRLLIAAALAATATTAYVLACGPFLLEYRTVETIAPAHPDEYLRGNVGIVRPKFARRFLVQAYRRFSGLAPLPELPPLSPRPDMTVIPARTALDDWIAVRGTVVDPSAPQASPSNPYETEREIGASYQSIRNCLDDAFVSAVRTAKARITAFGGETTPKMREWVRAQDAVFANCKGEPLVLPDEAPAGADAMTRSDRAYQTAAAYFYATRFDEAAQRFRAIAADTTSPWRPYGRYLAARALVRSATVPEKAAPEALATAETELRKVLDDPSAASLHASARGLLDFIEAHLHPAERLRVVSGVLTGTGPISAQQLVDYQWLMDHYVGDTTDYAYDGVAERNGIIASSDMNDWMLAMQADGTGGFDRAIAQWKRVHTAPWLVAALWHVTADHAEAPALLQAASAIDRSSPAFATLAFLRVRLLARRGETAQARALLAALPDKPGPGFEPETLNLLSAERLMLATSLQEALKYVPRTIVSQQYDGSAWSTPATNAAPVMDADAEILFTQRLPLSLLVEAASSEVLPARLRQRVAGAALVRALLLKRYPEALEAATALHGLVPSLQPELDRLRSAATVEDKHRAGLLLLLRRPGLRGGVQGLDDEDSLKAREPSKNFDHTFRRNWWCSFDPGGAERRLPESGLIGLVYDGQMPSPGFVSNDDRAALDREFTALTAVGTAPTYLAHEAVTWAVARPTDEDAAEALAHAVEGTRWGCADKTTSAASRAAFQTLHRLFPKSEWARRTRYWY